MTTTTSTDRLDGDALLAYIADIARRRDECVDRAGRLADSRPDAAAGHLRRAAKLSKVLVTLHAQRIELGVELP